MVAPVLDELATEYKGKATVAKVNAAENVKLATQFRIIAVPAFFVIKNGQVIDQASGARSKKDFKAMIDRAIA
jgi:thioredoxin 1